MNEESFWIDAPAGPTSVATRFAPAATSRAARLAAPVDRIDGAELHHEATVGRRVAGLALVCAILFGLATLVGFAAEAYAAPAPSTATTRSTTLAPPAPIRIAKDSTQAPRPQASSH